METQPAHTHPEGNDGSRASGRTKRVLAWADAAFFLGFAAFIVARAHWNLRVWIGLALAASGFALWLTARLQLGSSFSIGAQARALVTTGLYSRFRHPIYLFGFIAYGGIFLVWGRWIPFLCFLLIYSIEVVRLRKEERLLEQVFGEKYRWYKAATWL